MQAQSRLAAQLAICRFDHWVKNLFVLPGIVLGAYFTDSTLNVLTILLGLLAVGFVASSNYVINEVLDAPQDRHHPTKRNRPIPSGRASVPVAYFQWLLLAVAGIGLAFWINRPFGWTLATLWVMGLIYNVPPVRAKELVWFDVLTESVNNPLRLAAGWYLATDTGLPPVVLLMSYWMLGSFFMSLKRFAELREIGDPAVAAAYRRSFRHYTTEKLLLASEVYGFSAVLLFGAFAAQWRPELLLAFPGVALLMSLYMRLSFQPNSAVAAPENLWRHWRMMATVLTTALIMLVLLLVDWPWFVQFLEAQS